MYLGSATVNGGDDTQNGGYLNFGYIVGDVGNVLGNATVTGGNDTQNGGSGISTLLVI